MGENTNIESVTAMADEKRTPEDELICEQLLGWKRADGGWIKQDGFMYGGCGTPSFTRWAETGLILEAWTAAGNDYDIEGTVTADGVKIAARLRQTKGRCYIGDFSGYNETAPLAIRDAALEYITSMQPSTSDLIMARGDGG